MGPDRITRLTEGQCQCLRLVFAHKSSKEIAIVLGKSPFAIDKRIERAIRTLGVENRIDAARLLDQFEKAGPYERLACEPSDLAGPGARAIILPSQSAEGPDGARIRDSNPIGRGPPDDWLAPQRRNFRWPLPAKGDQRNDLTIIEQLIWIAVGILLFIVALLLALAGAESLQRTLWGIASQT
jgi:DNA-binding CsgD family transcriptional regulator